jgi:hypothetical protein
VSAEVIGILVLVAAPLGLVVVAIVWWDKRDMEDRDGGRSPDSPWWWRLTLSAVAVGLVASMIGALYLIFGTAAILVIVSLVLIAGYWAGAYLEDLVWRDRAPRSDGQQGATRSERLGALMEGKRRPK